MIAPRRFGPPIAFVLLGAAGLIARLGWIQIVERDVWAHEAARLLRTSHTLPCRRGPILDRDGRVLVRDEEVYAVDLVYRDLRRGHLLGQVAHARAALAGAPVSLERTLEHLDGWAFALARLRPAELERFARGEGLLLGGVRAPPARSVAARRLRRDAASDVAYYVRRLLGADRREWSAFRERIEGGGGERSYIELLAEVRRGATTEGLEAELAARCVRARDDLVRLAQGLALEDASGAPPVDAESALARLLFRLEGRRREVDLAIADALFREACDFSAGRLPPAVLERLDLDWLALALGWDRAALDRWRRGARERWREGMATLGVPAAVIRAELDSDVFHPAHRWLSELSALFAAEPRAQAAPDWTRPGPIAVLDELDGLFEDIELAPAAPEGVVLPWRSPPLARRARRGEDPLDLLALALPSPEPADAAGEDSDGWRPPASAAEARRRIAALFGDPTGLEAVPGDRERLPLWAVGRWQGALEEEVERRLATALASGAPLRLAAWRVERALEQRDYLVRDRSARAEVLAEDGSYDVVYLLTRYPARFAGFRVRPTTRRRALVRDTSGRLPAAELVGTVRPTDLRQGIEQVERRRRLRALAERDEHTPTDRRELEELLTGLVRNDQMHGASGIEGLLDSVLRGRNGYEESVGLTERARRGGRRQVVPPVDGLAVELTIDAELQAAAQDVLDHPVLPPSERRRDEAWFQNPVGAIVLVGCDGEVLAAASTPREASELKPGRDGQERLAIERTLRMPTFQPIGSVFKPFVAAWALERGWLAPDEALPCLPGEDGEASYLGLHCWHRSGHGALDLEGALMRSCNAYFAQVGERIGSAEGFRELCHAFGFDRPTGVTNAGDAAGLYEQYRMPALRRLDRWTRRDLLRAGNGLGVIEATPLQVARATCALATGRLPELSLVRAIGGEPVPRRFEPLAIDEAALARVRRALRTVVADPRGTAHGKGLSRAELGFSLAAKTGSADYLPLRPEALAGVVDAPGAEVPAMRKHTWLAGWFPAEAPRAVLVVYLHDTVFTSSHTAVHVAAQFLARPELRAFLAEEGS